MHCQRVDRLYVEVVRRLIQDQQVMIGQQQLHERDSATLATAQRADLGIKIDIGQQMTDNRSPTSIGSPYMVWRTTNDVLAYGRISGDLVSLRQEADREVAGACYPATVRDQHPGQNPQQGGLAASIAAHNPNHLAPIQAETDAGEERTSAVAHRNALGVDQVAH